MIISLLFRPSVIRGPCIRDNPNVVLVSTPKAFSIAQANNPDLLGWQQFSLVVFDEVHHVIKDHPYRKIAQHMRRHSQESSGVRILGLTASISYAGSEFMGKTFQFLTINHSCKIFF